MPFDNFLGTGLTLFADDAVVWDDRMAVCFATSCEINGKISMMGGRQSRTSGVNEVQEMM